MNDYARIETYAEEAEQIVECLQQHGLAGGISIAWPEDARLQRILKVAEECLEQPMGQANLKWLMQKDFQR